MTHPTSGMRWRPARHPSIAGFFCLICRDEIGQYLHLGNRMSDRPPVEAFASREQAERVAEHLARKAE